MKPIIDLEVEQHNDQGLCSIECVYDGARFHVWIDQEFRPTSGPAFSTGIMYKNPVRGVKSGQPGYFATRRMGLDRGLGAKLFPAMVKRAKRDCLMEMAQASFEAQKRKKAEETAARVLEHRKEKAGPALFAALDGIAKIVWWSEQEARGHTPALPPEDRARVLAICREAFALVRNES